ERYDGTVSSQSPAHQRRSPGFGVVRPFDPPAASRDKPDEGLEPALCKDVEIGPVPHTHEPAGLLVDHLGLAVFIERDDILLSEVLVRLAFAVRRGLLVAGYQTARRRDHVASFRG